MYLETAESNYVLTYCPANYGPNFLMVFATVARKLGTFFTDSLRHL